MEFYSKRKSCIDLLHLLFLNRRRPLMAISEEISRRVRSMGKKVVAYSPVNTVGLFNCGKEVKLYDS